MIRDFWIRKNGRDPLMDMLEAAADVRSGLNALEELKCAVHACVHKGNKDYGNIEKLKAVYDKFWPYTPMI